MISLVAAVAKNGVIGRKNALAWKIPEDLRFFRALTRGSPVIMGRKTFESIGRLLPERENIVISRAPLRAPATPHLHGCTSLNAAIELARSFTMKERPEIFVIGGGQIYAEALALADRLYITEIEQDVEGDAFFPSWDRSHFERHESEVHESVDPDQPEPWRFRFVRYDRRPKSSV